MFDFGQEVQQVNQEWVQMLSQEEQMIAARIGEEDDWQGHDIAEREGGVIRVLKRLEQEGHISRDEAILLAWAANVKI